MSVRKKEVALLITVVLVCVLGIAGFKAYRWYEDEQFGRQLQEIEAEKRASVVTGTMGESLSYIGKGYQYDDFFEGELRITINEATMYDSPSDCELLNASKLESSFFDEENSDGEYDLLACEMEVENVDAVRPGTGEGLDRDSLAISQIVDLDPPAPSSHMVELLGEGTTENGHFPLAIGDKGSYTVFFAVRVEDADKGDFAITGFEGHAYRVPLDITDARR